MKDNKCLIMGLPNAGKTTFLAALWYVISNGENDARLELLRIEGNTNYLARLSEQWLECKPLARTKRGEEVKNLTVYLTDNKENYTLQFPDLSGETFQHWYTDRKIEESLAEQVKEADSILFFINVKDVIVPFLINEANQFLDIGKDEISGYPRNKIEHDPVCVQIIELLQFILSLKQAQRIKLGIIFSAWDLLEENSKKPEEYAKQELPLLWQFLKTNKNRFEVKYWGISALGGEIEESDKLLSYEHPYERIQVIDNDMNKSHDITSVVHEMIGEIDG